MGNVRRREEGASKFSSFIKRNPVEFSNGLPYLLIDGVRYLYHIYRFFVNKYSRRGDV